MLSLQEISDRLEIQQKMTDYSAAIDHKDYDALDAVFTPDAYIDYRVMGGIDGRISAARALDYAKGVSALLAGINDVYLTEGVSAVAGVASKQGSGAFQTVVQVSVGRVVDTIRSRRSKLDEDPQFWGMP